MVAMVSVLGGGAAMEDILSQGGDRGPSRWPRRLAVIGAGVLVVVLGVVYLSRAGHSHSPPLFPRRPSAPARPSRAGSPGPTCRWPAACGCRSRGAAGLASPATGVSARIGGCRR